jgi:hypothetical protein
MFADPPPAGPLTSAASAASAASAVPDEVIPLDPQSGQPWPVVYGVVRDTGEGEALLCLFYDRGLADRFYDLARKGAGEDVRVVTYRVFNRLPGDVETSYVSGRLRKNGKPGALKVEGTYRDWQTSELQTDPNVEAPPDPFVQTGDDEHGNYRVQGSGSDVAAVKALVLATLTAESERRKQWEVENDFPPGKKTTRRKA